MLSIGSIVYLKNGNQKLMIINLGSLVKQNEKIVYFDYSAVKYPEGLDPEKIYYFNKEDIDEVVFKGYSDDEEKRLEQLYKEWVKSKKYPQGKVTE